MGDTKKETANFFAQNSHSNGQGGLWGKMEKCLITCLRTVLAIEAAGAELKWTFQYSDSSAPVAKKESLYPKYVTYHYDFKGAECWTPGTATGNYNFDDTLGLEAWPNTWESGEKTKGINTCDDVRQATGSAMFPTVGNFRIDNLCDAPWSLRTRRLQSMLSTSASTCICPAPV